MKPGIPRRGANGPWRDINPASPSVPCPRCQQQALLRDGIAVAILQGEPKDLPGGPLDASQYVGVLRCKILKCPACGMSEGGYVFNGTFFGDRDMIPLEDLWDRTKRKREYEIDSRYPDGEPSC